MGCLVQPLSLLPPQIRRPQCGWFAHVLVLAGAVFLWLEFRLSFGDLGLWPSLGVALEVALLGFILRPLFSDAAARSRQPWAEAARWLGLTVIALALTLPYARPERVGAGDAQDYAEHLADFIAQVRQGVFPVLVGQSRFAFNGAFNPLRTAPYFQYLGGALSALTFGALGPFALQNLEIILSLVAAAFSAYLCLLRLAPRRGWLCLLLTALYLSSPGVLALAYSGDMIPSWLTLPYLPAFAYLFVRISEQGINHRRLNALAVVMAVLWTAHAPIAMWLTFLALPVVLIRLLLLARTAWRQSLLWGIAALTLFAVLAGYEFVSVASLRLPGIPPHFIPSPFGSAHEVLGEGWRGWLRPVSPNASNLLGDLQLSAGLWCCLLLGFLGWRKGGWGLRVLALASLSLLALLLPAVAGLMWAAIPGWVGQITDQWPAQCFFPILSALAPFAALLACERSWSRRPQVTKLVFGLLALSCLWSGWEARKFLLRAYRVGASPALSRRLIAGQSTVLSVYSYAMVAELPRYFSYGPVKPELQLHLLDGESLEIVDTNQKALLSGRVPSEKIWTQAFTPVPGGAILQPELQLPEGRNYVFLFNFKGPPEPGTLVVSGHNFWREYPLPSSGGELAFGIGGDRSSVIGLHVPAEGGPESVAMRYVAASGSAARPLHADLGIVSYASADLPLRLLSLQPYRVEANAPHGGWLETPRIFIPGYQASLDGQAAAPERSPDGLVMLRVPPGKSTIELRYDGTTYLRVAFWMSFAGWLLLALVALVRSRLAIVSGLTARTRQAAQRWQAAWPRLAQAALPTVLAGLYLSTALLAYCNFRRARALEAARNQLVFTLHFPKGKEGDTVELKRLENKNATGSLYASYLNRDHVRLQFVQPDGTRSTSDALLVNFQAEQKIECTQLPGGVDCLFFNNRLI